MIASYISEQVTDEVYGAMIKSYKVLMGDASGIQIDSPPRRSRLSSTDSSRHGASDISITDSSHQSDHSPLVSNFSSSFWVNKKFKFFYCNRTEIGIFESCK